MSRPAFRDLPGGTVHVAAAQDFPISVSMTAVVMRLKPGALQELHWHPNAAEWFYVSRGQVEVTLFAADKHLATADIRSGDCAFVPQGFGHSVQNIGMTECEIIGVLNVGRSRDRASVESGKRAVMGG